MPNLPKPGAVLFVEDVSAMAAFYRELASMDVLHDAPDHVVLEIEGLQLVIHGLPPQAIEPREAMAPLQIREDSYWKLCFPVPSIAGARATAGRLGGAIRPPEAEWEARGFRACDGHDPEGNVLQVREPARSIRIEAGGLEHPAVQALLREHLENMYELSPPESVHALDLDKLRGPEIAFWTVWEGDLLLGCGALKELDPKHGEIKSMRTPGALRRRGAGRAVLAHMIDVAKKRGYQRLSLETGSFEAFRPAQTLYESFGFVSCGPFGDYREDPNSAFMTLELRALD